MDPRISQGWTDHADDPEGVLARLAGVAADAEDTKALAVLGTLQVHILAQHLGRFADALGAVHALRQAPAYDPAHPFAASLHRLDAAMRRCLGDVDAAEASVTSAGGDPRDQRLRAWAIAAPALAAVGGDAGPVLDEAAALADALQPNAAHPASRSLAIGANNVAGELASARRDPEVMLRAAHLARRWWAVAGDWINVRIAEVQLSKCFLVAGDAAAAAAHARAALALVDANGGALSDRFYATLALAEAVAAAGDDPAPHLLAAHAQLADMADPSWAASELAAARERLA